MSNIVNIVVGSLSCANSSVLPKAESPVPYLASFIATYTGGNGSSYPTQDVTSTGVVGLTAHLDSGILNNGAGNLVYVITGTPTTTGTANFTISIGGKSCSFGITVVEKGQGGATTSCPTDYTNCTYRSIVLDAGEQYILPSNAEIIFVSNPTALTSDNDCAADKLPTQEYPIVCYTFETLIGSPGGHTYNDSCDQHWESFTYAGVTVGLNGNNTGICGQDGNVVGVAQETWNALKGNPTISPLILGVAAAREGWSNGDQYGIKIRMYDLGIDPPMMVIRDGNNRNPYDDQNLKVETIGRIIDCGQCSMDGSGQHYAGYGDPGVVGPCN